MLSVSELLLTYHIPGVRAAEIRRICADEIGSITGYPLNAKQVQYKNDCVHLSVPPLVKSALILKHDELNTRLTARGLSIKTIK